MPHLRLEADYSSWPLWQIEQADISVNLDPASLPVPQELADALHAWGDAYDETIDQDYPPDSGFVDEAAAAAWLKTGSDLAARLERELTDAGYRVEYSYAGLPPAAFVRGAR